MAIQILPARQKAPTFLESLGLGLGQGMAKLPEQIQEHQKKKQFAEALQNVQGAYGDPNLSEQQKLIQAYQQLAGNPEVAQQLGGQLSRLGGQQESFRNKLLGKQQEQEQLAQSLQNIQGLYADPNLSEEQKVFGVYQELSSNPSLANNLLNSMQKKEKSASDTVGSELFSRGYNALLEGDNATFRDVVSDPDTPLPVKRQLTELQNKLSTRKDVQARESRARQNIVQKSYKQALDHERTKLKDSFVSRKESEVIKKNIKRLEALQNHDMKRLAKDPNAYNSLSLWNHVDPDFLPNDEDIDGEFNPPEEQKEKMRFDSKNPEHVAYARHVLEQAGGDRAKANAILAEEFTK